MEVLSLGISVHTFGLSDARKTLLRLMEALFGPEVWPYIMVYLNGVIIISETLE